MRKTSRKPNSTAARAEGEYVASVGQGYALIRTARVKRASTVKSDSAYELLKRAGKALSKPGISRDSVFRDSLSGVFAYSVYEADPSKIVRKSADGRKTIGRVVDGKFKAR